MKNCSSDCKCHTLSLLLCRTIPSYMCRVIKNSDVNNVADEVLYPFFYYEVPELIPNLFVAFGIAPPKVTLHGNDRADDSDLTLLNCLHCCHICHFGSCCKPFFSAKSNFKLKSFTHCITAFLSLLQSICHTISGAFFAMTTSCWSLCRNRTIPSTVTDNNSNAAYD